MWRPAEPVKHRPPFARWPDRAEAAESRCFSALSVGRLSLNDRTWVPAMVPWRATEEGFVTPEVLAWYERFARGRPSGLVVEATGVRDVPSGPLLRIGHDRFVPGLSELVKVVRAASDGHTRLFIQLIDFLAIRRRPQRTTYLRQFLAITDCHRQAVRDVADTDEQVRDALIAMTDEQLAGILTPRELESLTHGFRERVTDVDRPHIRDLPRTLPGAFAEAAARAESAGFDGVELHYAHAYTMASFLSARNTRADGYGGPREQRVRLPIEVFEGVRARVSQGFIVGCRYLADEIIDGGSGLDDATYFGVELARAGMDYLSLSRGGKFEDARQPTVGWPVYPYTGRSGWECMPTVIADAAGPFGRNICAAGSIRQAVRAAGLETPIVVSGGICTFDQAEQILADGQADVIGAARQSLADPDWFRKVKLGLGAEVRRCEYTNYCEGLDQKHKPVTCKLWDRVDMENAGVHVTADGKRRLVAPRWSEWDLTGVR